MNATRIAVLAVAAVAAVGLAVVVRVALSGKPTTQAVARPIDRPRPVVRVLVARRDLRVGDRVSDNDLDWKVLPAETVNPAWITDTSASPAAVDPKPDPAKAPLDPATPMGAASTQLQRMNTTTTKQVGADGNPIDQMLHAANPLQSGGPRGALIGSVVREPIGAGEPVAASKVVRAGESGYLAIVLAPGKRAVSIPVTVDSAAGGFVLPGDRVDVILSRKLETGSSNALFVSQTILQNMKVLAIDQTTRPDKDAAAVVGATATLEVGQKEAEFLAVSKAAGTLSLSLRAYADAHQASGRATTGAVAHLGGEGAHNDAADKGDGVKVFRNGVGSLSPVTTSLSPGAR